MAGAQQAMTLRKCEPNMATNAERWNLRDCIADSAESWLKECIGPDFDLDKLLLES